jgi:hypothetical protein
VSRLTATALRLPAPALPALPLSAPASLAFALVPLVLAALP